MLKMIERRRRQRLLRASVSMRPNRSLLEVVALWVLLAGLAVGMCMLGGVLGYHWRQMELDQHLQNRDRELSELRELHKKDAERLGLLDQQLIVERTTRETLAKDLRDAQLEAQVRQQALDFYDHLLISNDRSRPARFAGCEWRAQGDNRYRYRLLLAQGQNSAADYNGRVVVVVAYLLDKKLSRTVLGEDRPMPVKFRHYQRLEADLALPAGAQPQTLEARIMSPDGRQQVASCQKRIGGA
jgi:hypothetical protein